MRTARNSSSLLRTKRRRGFFRLALRPGRLLPSPLTRYYTVGGVLSGPPGARRWAMNLVRREIADGTYLSDWRLNAALDRMIANVL